MERTARITVFLIAVLLVSTVAWAHPASVFVVDGQGQVYFSDLKRIWKIGADGRLSVFITGKHTHQLYLDAEGNLCGDHLVYQPAGELWIHSWWKATPDGLVTDIIAPTAAPPPGFSLFRDSAGNMYSWGGSGNNRRTESHILKRTPQGEVGILAGRGWGRRDGKGQNAQLASVGGMAWGPDGAIYFTDTGSIRRLALDGTVTTIAAGGKLAPSLLRRTGMFGRFNPLMGLALDSRANIYVASVGEGEILKVTPRGEVTVFAKSGRGWAPSAITVVDDEIYVLEGEESFSPRERGPRIRKFLRDGSARVLAVAGESSERAGR